MNECAASDAHALKCELACEVLLTSGRLTLGVTGWSMLPAIFPGDTLMVERVSGDQFNIGEVVLIGRNGRLCVHRVISREENSGRPHWITQGDSMPMPDPPVKENELLGRVNYVIRDGKCVAVSAKPSIAQKVTTKVVRHSFLAARAFVYLHRTAPMPGMKFVSSAAKRRQNAAHGVSRG